MKIEHLDPKESKGSILAQSYNLSERKLSKGTRVSKAIVELLNKENIKTILCAVPHENDMDEDAAAEAISNAIDRNRLFAEEASTGRVNFRTPALGVVRYNRELIKKINLVDESIAFSIVEHNQLLAKNDLIATLKIIPFFVSKIYVERVVALLSKHEIFKIHRLEEKKVGFIQTYYDWQKRSIFKATSNVTRSRLDALGCLLEKETLIPHDHESLCSEIKSSLDSGTQVLLISGASAITDRSDYIPKAILSVGGEIIQYGLAVDPGNLLLIGQIGNTTIIGMPGCARSPKLNGFDWVLQLLMANIPITKEELADMGAGGLLMEIASRPLPRALSKSVNKREKK